jgi:hypothetical protein
MSQSRGDFPGAAPTTATTTEHHHLLEKMRKSLNRTPLDVQAELAKAGKE